ncbi:Alpha/Beta hydrolase protein [Xylariomycetidae sp. FL2044]|nr:Alpha/Beta hydrolase protein [Xylariomycetidae sp. FL2044]
MFKKISGWRERRVSKAADIDSSHRSATVGSNDCPSYPQGRPGVDPRNTSIPETSGPGPLGLNVIYTPPSGHKADIVFVHGLGGTSRWTWTKDRDPKLFWPLTFLPLEPGFSSIRVSTFGYNASFQKPGNITTSILDFAKDLLFNLKNARNQNLDDLEMGKAPLIFVAHSMGGLIVKEAYLQGVYDPEYESIVKAVSAIVFIATPHRGTNLAQTLNRILDATMVSNPKHYVADLARNSIALEKLNEQFRHVAPRLDIVSFYETLPTSIGMKYARLMVLEKLTSILGYPGEVSKELYADHHSACKYEGREDPNYIAVRNILKSLLEKVVSNSEITLKDSSACKKHGSLQLKSLLTIPGLPDADYMYFRDRWTPGTNDWILHDPTFLKWRDAVDEPQSVLWVCGEAATGKSVLSSFVINNFTEQGRCCQYFFIRFSDRLKRTINFLLRSLAFQLGQAVPGLADKMTDIIDKALDLESADPRLIWDRIFQSLLFKLKSETAIYWVIDGLDEAEDPQTLVGLLMNISSTIPIRIFVASRQSSELVSAFTKPSGQVKLRVMKFEGRVEDLRQYIRSELRMPGAQHVRDDVGKRIVEGSRNNFLVRVRDGVHVCYQSHRFYDSSLDNLGASLALRIV